jgi:broad specificity phosphatase PhoE
MMSASGPLLPTCAVHQSRQLSEALRTCQSNGRHSPIVLVSHDAFNSALLAQINPTLAEIGQRTACYNQLSYVDSAWRVDAYDVKPE